MNIRSIATGCLVSMTMLVAGQCAFAEMTLTEALSVTGAEVIEVAPETMSMRLRLEAVAPDLDASIANIKGQIDAMSKALESIEPKPVIKISDLVLQGKSAQDVERMMMQRMRGRFGEENKEETPKEEPVKLTSEVTATWNLPAGDSAAQMRSAYTIEKAVRAAMPKMEQEKKEMTEEEEEMMLMYQNEQEQIQPGQPAFFFTATLAPEDRKDGVTKALANARENASELAGLAGLKIGSINQIASKIYPRTEEDGYRNYAMRQWYGIIQEGSEAEATSTTPVLQKVKFQIMVSVSFEILHTDQ